VKRASSPYPVHPLTCAFRCLDILSKTEDSLCFRFSAFFRADPCLRLLEELKEDLKQRVQRMTVRGLHQKMKSTSYTPQDARLIILDACNAHQTDAALPTAEMSSSAAATRQPAELSSGHNTTTEPTGTSAGNLRHRATTADNLISNGDASGSKGHISFTYKSRFRFDKL